MSYADRQTRSAAQYKGWLATHKWLLIRRVIQLGILSLFLVGPVFGFWIVEGTLSQSLTLGVLPLSDPFLLSQSLAAGHLAAGTALLGGAIVLVVYAIIGGRVYCSFVCPINIVTDAAQWMALRLNMTKGWQPRRDSRIWVLVGVISVAFLSGTMAWELVNPVTIVHRAIVFGIGYAWTVILAIFLFDLTISRRGWCGHLCPMGAFYGLIGRLALVRVSAKKREACDKCMDCFDVCPEPHVINPALQLGEKKAHPLSGPIILSGDCTNCGRCIDVCSKDVFSFDLRFHNAAPEQFGEFAKDQDRRAA